MLRGEMEVCFHNIDTVHFRGVWVLEFRGVIGTTAEDTHLILAGGVQAKEGLWCSGFPIQRSPSHMKCSSYIDSKMQL